MDYQYVGFDFTSAPIERQIELGTSLGYPDYYADILPLMCRHPAGIDRLVLISNRHLRINVRQLAKTPCELRVTGNIVYVENPDLTDERLMKSVDIYSDYRNELNLLFQSHGAALLEEFFRLFPSIYRVQGSLSDILDKRDHQLMVDVVAVIGQLDNDSFLISSMCESNLYCILAHAAVLDKVRGWS